jgi:cell wall-associated NlpC family hydrolase
VVASAYGLLDAPYRYSGADPSGFDCSGLTHYLFAAAGVSLPRTTAGQAGVGRRVALDELAAGDLIFFAKADKPNHVGLVVSAPGEPLRMIHASNSRGVVETYVLSDAYWLARLRFGRRVLGGG